MRIRRSVRVSDFRTVAILAVAMLVAGSHQVSAMVESKAPQAAPAASAEVKIDNFSFAPTTLTVGVGTTVTWTNRDDIPHTVVSTEEPKAFKSKVLDTDEKFSYTFTKAGTYPYFCSVHPKMTGTVVVK